MTDEYVWNLLPWQQALLWIGGVLLYVICGGFAWALTSAEFDNEDLHKFAACSWPITLVVFVMYGAAQIGPRAVARWRQRGRLPRAEVRHKGA